MKLNILTTAAILAISGVAMTQTAKAQSFTTPSGNGAPVGDLILGFTNGSAGGTNLEIDLGSFSLYTGNSQINITNISSDLSALYGSFYSNLSLQVAIGGVTANGILVSNPTNTAYGTISDNSLAGARSNFANFGVVDQATPTPVAGTAANSLRVASSNGDSLDSLQAVDGFSVSSSGATFNGTSDPILYLNVENSTGTGTKKDTSAISGNAFSINSSGEVVYDAQTGTAPVPEPSTYALGLAGLLLLVVLKRRQSMAKL